MPMLTVVSVGSGPFQNFKRSQITSYNATRPFKNFKGSPIAAYNEELATRSTHFRLESRVCTETKCQEGKCMKLNQPSDGVNFMLVFFTFVDLRILIFYTNSTQIRTEIDRLCKIMENETSAVMCTTTEPKT